MMKTYVKISLAVVSLLAISGILAALYMYNMKPTDTSKVKPDFVVTAAALLKEFEDNEITASAKYVNKIVEVSGIIASVKPAENEVINISLSTASDFSSIIATLNASILVLSLKPGDEVTLRGECSGYLLDVLLNNCSIVK